MAITVNLRYTGKNGAAQAKNASMWTVRDKVTVNSHVFSKNKSLN